MMPTIPSEGLHFVEETHTYYWNGQRRPSITQVLNEYSKVKLYDEEYYVCGAEKDKDGYSPIILSERFRKAADFGRAVHKMGFYLFQEGGEIDQKLLNKAPGLIPPYESLQEWIRAFKPRAKSVEEPMYSPKFGYAGTPDFVGFIDLHPELTVIEVKTPEDSPLVGPQTAAQEQLFREAYKYRKPMKRAVLYVPKNGGRARFIVLKNTMDWNRFLWKLNEYNMRRS